MFLRVRPLCLVVSFFTTLVVGQQAAGSLIGDTIAVSINTSSAGFGPIGVTHIDVEVTDSFETFNVFGSTTPPESWVIISDVSADTFQLIFSGGPNEGAVFDATVSLQDLDWRDDMGAILPGVLLNVTQTDGPDMVSSIMFDEHSVTVVMDTLDLMANEMLIFDFALATSHPIPLIPEPATMTLLGLGLAGMALGRRRWLP